MITFTISVPNVAQVLGAGFANVQLTKSANQQQSGSYANVAGASAALVSNTTSYTVTDVSGGSGDWYAVVYTQAGGTNPSAPGTPMPGYLTDLCNTIRDLLGVSTVELTDTQIQGFAYLPTALGRIRQRLASDGLTFDTLIATGGDAGALALGALAHLTGALLVPRMSVVVLDGEKLKDYSYQRQRKMDWNQTLDQLQAQYELLISQAAAELATSAAVTAALPGVLLGGPTSGGYDTTAGLTGLRWPGQLEDPYPPLPNNAPEVNLANDWETAK